MADKDDKRGRKKEIPTVLVRVPLPLVEAVKILSRAFKNASKGKYSVDLEDNSLENEQDENLDDKEDTEI